MVLPQTRGMKLAMQLSGVRAVVKRSFVCLVGMMMLTSASAGATSPTAQRAGAATPASSTTPDISCPGDVVVWVNPRSKAYHLQGDSFFGHTKRGKFECKKAADAAGDHPIPGKSQARGR